MKKVENSISYFAASPKILAEMMKECNISKKLADDILFLVCHHETGGTRRVDILRDADSISFFHVNLPYYFIWNGVEETKERCLWGYRKLPEKLKRVVAEFDYQNKELGLLVRTCISEAVSQFKTSTKISTGRAL